MHHLILNFVSVKSSLEFISQHHIHLPQLTTNQSLSKIPPSPNSIPFKTFPSPSPQFLFSHPNLPIPLSTFPINTQKTSILTSQKPFPSAFKNHPNSSFQNLPFSFLFLLFFFQKSAIITLKSH